MALPADDRQAPGDPRRRNASLLRSILRAFAALAVVCMMGVWLTRTFWDDAAQNQSLRDLRTGSKEERLIAAGQLVATPRPERAETVFSALIQALHDDDDEVRSAAVNSLGMVVRQSLDSWTSVPSLLQKNLPLATAASRATLALLEDKNSQVQYEALRALLAIHVGWISDT